MPLNTLQSKSQFFERAPLFTQAYNQLKLSGIKTLIIFVFKNFVLIF